MGMAKVGRNEADRDGKPREGAHRTRVLWITCGGSATQARARARAQIWLPALARCGTPGDARMQI